MLLKWKSLDEMRDVKNDQESSFNTLFVPLTNQASGDSKTTIYTVLYQVHAKPARCLVM